MEVKERLGDQLATITGGINLASPKQLTTYLYDTLGLEEATDYRGNVIKTDTGNRSADAEVLSLLKAKTKEQETFLTLYREYNKQAVLLSKNLDYFQRTCKEKGCKFYGSLNQNVVQTHRLSASGRP